MLKNITFTADASLIERARQRVAASNMTLNELFVPGWRAMWPNRRPLNTKR
jgi:hypothetical protein